MKKHASLGYPEFYEIVYPYLHVTELRASPVPPNREKASEWLSRRTVPAIPNAAPVCQTSGGGADLLRVKQTDRRQTAEPKGDSGFLIKDCRM